MGKDVKDYFLEKRDAQPQPGRSWMGGRRTAISEKIFREVGVTGSWTRNPSGGAVVIGTLSPETMARLTKAAPGPVTKVSEAPPTLVIGGKAEDARRLCERINQVVGAEGVVAPLLADADGNRLFPTGHLQVRFEDEPSDGMLSVFAARHRFELAGRNKWAPRQADFLVRRDDERFLPDIASAMAKGEGVIEAWPVVRAAFRRLPR
jgi:hypothetical protein